MTALRPASAGCNEGVGMPMIVWLLVGAAVWLAAVSVICVLLTIVKRTQGLMHPPLLADRADGARPISDTSGPCAPPVRTRQPRLTAAAPALVAGGADHLPVRDDTVDRSSTAHAYTLHLREQPVAQLRWCTDTGLRPGWYLSQGAAGWQRLPLDAKFGPSEPTASVGIAHALDAAA